MEGAIMVNLLHLLAAVSCCGFEIQWRVS